MSRPIPKSRLKQSVKYEAYDSSGRDNAYSAAVTIEHVFYEENAALIRDANGNIVKSATLLIYDNMNSEPMGIVFKEEDRVTINVGAANQKVLKVVSTSTLFAGYPHHQEVILQ